MNINELEKICSHCNEGYITQEKTTKKKKKKKIFYVPCSYCKGTGKILTDKGKEFIDFLLRQEILKDFIDEQIYENRGVNCFM